MAFFDDAEWLQSHIVNSFITSDDTGVCELVMTVESAESLAAGDAAERDTYFEPHSPEIVMDMDIGGHRRRSNTSQRLDKLKKERKNAARVKNVIWQPNPDPLPDADRNFLFEKKPIVRHAGPKPSLLTEHLNMLDLSDNPYTEYSKFDGRAHAGVPTRRINIFLTMAPAEELAFPMSVTVVASARVSDVIGLICWQYTNEDREPPLRGSPEMYSLHIAEDDGEVDWDFPPLDDRETVAKFGFNVLALVETEQTEVTVSLDGPDGKDQVTLSLKKRNATVAEMLNAVLAQRPDVARETGVELALERADVSTAASPLSADTRLSQLACQHFNLVKTAPGRKHKDAAVVEEPNFSGQMSAMEATVYQSFKVNMLSNLVIKAPIQLGISGDRVEIDPVQVRSTLNVSKFLSKPRAVTYQIDSIMECRLWEVKYGGRAIVRLTYLLPSDGGYRHHDLEADLGTAKDIVRKLEYILEFRSGMSRKTYLQQKEKRSLLASLAAK
ncbi:target of rapamycin complex 2 subunit MAPKAP1-like isoform X2 [Pollicipes pollicipes]|nr:target of rapamycin complex 2 subunit MAPKAP1-like isoform X1 [Pollicipes pollicipes]XP_037079861.1 target of rapamycin complex 2 subunit MAPKAP1-like isoform X1 [Pollicipes pollicipes]XP_037080503.1 target of rapamycin complex 2 subunit MAPKAP1-like isoform X2 [Pollicipes pollicipes]XP_037080504.1 target of rapamycin complex 2 subunit MAPKAP1-like isoform X2 [Pollicipes pollicipes]